ncbi:hypothetical protein D477_009610 [Arthrobacter crystallopoietes BAB-32]|uniref:Uncharacterized protein n=1 Tax=Arthrobacter crystallopoietes BAB-32 TaxID=1246476 RepID=N1V2Y8_9MICC|nr:hypothetical protein [Arthrobacter crystallopoietes]EMY34427.1 hypothetical protein D477_009610 [Arthrobacter crystallopoietes BAB-32]
MTAAAHDPLVDLTPTRIRHLGALRRGDAIEARFHDDVQYRGRVDRTAPGVGLVWIREENGGRRAVSDTDYSIWRLPIQG